MLTWATGCASLPANVERPASQAFSAPEATPLGRLAAARRGQVNAASDSGFRVLDAVDLALTSRLSLVEHATRTLDLQYYAVHADGSTELLLQRLRAAAQRGVRVRILLDDFNTVGEDAQVLRLAFEPNVQIRLFNPLPGPRNSMLGRIITSLHDVERMQKRMHNKLFIADNAWGITGGRNLGDAYFGAGDKQNFVDLDVLAAGRIVRDMSASFDRYWNNELAYPVQALLDKDDLDRLQKQQVPSSTSVPPAAAVLPVAASGPQILPGVTPAQVADVRQTPMDLTRVELIWAPSILLVDQPGKVQPGDDEVNAGETLIDGLLGLMQQAKREVVIVSPYFVPGEQMMAVYAQLRQRGVRLRVLTNSLASNDAPAAHAGYARYRDRLLALGVELHEMRSAPPVEPSAVGSGASRRSEGRRSSRQPTRASLHTKMVIVDGFISVIGSMNLDLRSQLKNSEVALLIRSAAVARQAMQQLDTLVATSAYRLEQRGGSIVWRAPQGGRFPDATSEPEAGVKLKLMVRVLGPFAPDEML